MSDNVLCGSYGELGFGIYTNVLNHHVLGDAEFVTPNPME